MKNTEEHSEEKSAGQGVEALVAEPLKIGASTPYDFCARNLTGYGGLLPVATMLEKLGFQELVEETLTIRRQTRAMPVYRFVLGMVLVLYVGFSRLNHLRFVEREPMLTGILKVLRVPPQCTFWRFLASLHLSVAGQLLRVQQVLRQRVWQAAHVGLKTITLDTDTTINTLFGHQMGGRKGYNPKNKGKKSYQPILDVSGRNSGIHRRGVAQRRPADGRPDRASSGKRVRGLAAGGGDDVGASRFRRR